MPIVDVVVDSPIIETFRVAQIKGMFDLPLKDKLRHEWKLQLPIEGWQWNVGLIVGPSGSGKSTIARKIFGDRIHVGFDWPKNKAVVEGFRSGVPIQEIIEVLSSVGFSSPPSWCKPFNVLSNGEKFRAELARAMIEVEGLLVVDEFTSVVDRTVAKIGSAAVSKTIRRRGGQMIALSCHYDIVEWLEPDWILDLKDDTFVRRHLRRPEINLELRGIAREAWRMFAKHHYLNAALALGAQSYGCFWGSELVAFCALMPLYGFKGCRRVHRIVVLPEYQGVGIGRATLGMMGDYLKAQGLKLSITSSHPAIIKGLKHDSRWRCSGFYGNGSSQHSSGKFKARSGVILASYQYVGI